MKISIITVSYNSSKTIRDTIESVLNQTFEDIEFIVVDGSSNDNTLKIVKEYEPKFEGRMRWISEKDKGIYDAMNKGILMSNGDVIGILNSDDFFTDKNVISKIMWKFENDKFLDSVYADISIVSQNDTTKIVRSWKVGIQRPFKLGWHPAHPSFFLKKEVYKKYGLYNLEFKLAADFEIMLRVLEKRHISSAYLNETIVKMRSGGASNKNIINAFTRNAECIRAFRENGFEINPTKYLFFRLIPKLIQSLK